MMSVLSSLPSSCDRLDDAADLVVGIGEIRAIDVGLLDEELLLDRRELGPLLQHVLRPGRQLGILRDHAEPLLVGEDLVAHGVPALIEQMHGTDLIDPLLRRMVRRVRAARGVVQQEWHVRIDVVELIHPLDGVIRHRGGQVPLRIPDEGLDMRGVAEQRARRPLVGVAAHEAVEVLRSPCRWATGRTDPPALV